MVGLIDVNQDTGYSEVSMASVERGKCDEQHGRRCRVAGFEQGAEEARRLTC
jgi:hypothetical protein